MQGGWRPISPALKSEILARYDRYREQPGSGEYGKMTKLEAMQLTGRDVQRSQNTVLYVIKKYRPTVNLAEALLKANAHKLAVRILRKASVAESIDVLQRSNIGVLAPNKAAGGGGGGFFISVQADSCGAVKIGAGYAAGAEHPLPLQEGVERPLGLSGGSSGGSQEYGDGGDPFIVGVSSRSRDEGEEADETGDDAGDTGISGVDERPEAPKAVRSANFTRKTTEEMKARLAKLREERGSRHNTRGWRGTPKPKYGGRGPRQKDVTVTPE